MKKCILKIIKNISFRKKVTLSCILISLIPLLLLGTFGYFQVNRQIIEREQRILAETLRQEADTITNKLNSYQDALNVALWNENFKNSLLQTYETNYDMYMFYKETVDSLFLAARSLNPDIMTMTLYTEANLNPHGQNVLPLSSAENMPWYEKAVTSTIPSYTVSEDGQTVFLACRMYYRFPAPASVICIAVDTRQMLKSVNGLQTNGYGFILADAAGKLIYDSAPSGDTADDPLSIEQILSGAIPSIYAVEEHSISDSAWTAYLYRPLVDLRAATRNFTLTTVALICICILLSLLIASSFSKIIVSPLESLSHDMIQVKQGNYQITVVDDGREDEVGHLVQAFRIMVTQLNYYINEVLVATINQQKYELQILQSQINPHFLYNSLSLINSRAIMTKQSDISQMAQLLSSFYRTMLNKGKSVTTIQGELENTRAYVSIQQMMHSNSFEVVYEIDDQVLGCSVLNMILQPLAENAILHGLDHKETMGENVLTISCHEDEDDIIFKVIDNGCGMDEQMCQEILTADSGGYGVKNVHQRIQLYYGEGYGLQYRSTLGYGTCVTVRIAKKLGTI